MELRIEHLAKTYPNGVRALHDVTLTIPCGMFGLLGPNGAGKSTLMRTIATLQEPDAGSIVLQGISSGQGPSGSMDVLREKDRVRRTLGYLPQEFGVYPSVSAERLLDHFAVLEGFTDRAERRFCGRDIRPAAPSKRAPGVRRRGPCFCLEKDYRPNA